MSRTALLTLAPLALVLGVAFAVNLPTIDDYFHGDDYLAFIDLASTPTLKHLEQVITYKDSNVYWRPLGEVYYLVLYSAFGLNEVAFHLANIGVFLATLALLYAFCLQAGFGRLTAAVACAFFALFPNHVVSVAWITNGPRLLAVMFALASLVLLQRAIATRRWQLDALSFLAFVAAALSDEVALSLAPLAVVYAFFFDRREGVLGRTLIRALPYTALGLTLGPMQFLMTAGDPGFRLIRIGWQMPEHFWALISKLVLPSRDSISFSEIEAAQWVAGGGATALTALALVFGSNRLRFLALWVVLGLLPFTIWISPIAPARYLYMGAVPFAVIAAWAAASLVEWLKRTAPGSLVAANLPASTLLAGVLAVAVVFLGSVGAGMTQDRNRAYAADTETYRILAKGLKEAAPTVPQGARIVIYYGIWNTFHVWPDAVAQTVYKDETVRIVNVPRGQVESSAPGRGPKDVVLFYTGKGFIRSAPLGTSSSPGSR